MKNATVKDVLFQIEEQSEFYFLYNSELIDVQRKVDMDVQNEKVEVILNKLFGEGKINAIIRDRHIILTPTTSEVTVQQSRKVSGKVTDGSGAPVPGTTVVVKGTTNGTISDTNGNYSLSDVPEKATLLFSFVGMKPQEVAVEGKSTINVTLTEETFGIEEVVAIGYGVQRKEAITGSVASVKGDVMREIPSSNITQALQGRIAGVNMEQVDSKPGSTLRIRIRGTRSLTADNDPLVVLDGIPFAGSISDISPDDIKSVDILKDASATAIYGSRGANGVILITSNKGSKGEKLQVAYNGYYGVKSAIYYPMMNGSEFVALRKAAGVYATNGIDEADDVNTDWQSMFYRTGIQTNHDISLTGGTQKGSYKFGAGYYKDEAVIPGSDYLRYSIRSSVDQEVGKLIRLGFTSNNNYNITDGASLGLYGVLSMSPIANPYNADGSLKRTVQMPLDNQYVYTKGGLESLGDKWKDQTKAFGSYNSFYGELKIPGVEGLKYRANLGADFRMSNAGNYTGVGVFSTTPDNPSTASITNSLTTHWAIENLLTFDRSFADKHNLNVVAMYSAEETMYNSSNVAAKNIPADAFQFYNLGQAAAADITVNPNNQAYTVSSLESWMGRVMYSYNDRYMISATVRSDASSRLAPGHKWHTYPAVSVGWNIMKESFMSDITVINALKLRAGYGQTSNQAVAPYATLGRLNTAPYNFGTTYATGYNVSQLPNPTLGWEYSVTNNIGLDFSLLKNRLSGTAEYYITDTKDLLMSVNLPSTAGVGSYTANVGSTQNKGFEISLNGLIMNDVNGWTWDAGINLYTNKNKVTALASGQTRDEGNWWFVGHSINSVFDYKKIGLWNETDADYQYLQTLEPGGKVGMIKVLYTGTYDANGKPTRAIGAADRQVMDMDPDFQGGFNSHVAYKGFELSVVGSFQVGGTLISTLYGSGGYLNLLTGRRGNIKVDYWTPENTGAKYPNPAGPLSGDNPKYGGTLGYFDASYVKIRTITLGYNFKQKWVKNAGFERLRIYGTVTNPLILFSPYNNQSGMDPETNSYGDGNAAVALPQSLHRILTVGFNSPSTHNYMIGINMSF
jgi:TonB-linked SusC/RagA family outer membrane protein